MLRSLLTKKKNQERNSIILLTVAAIVHFAPGPIEQLEENDRFTFGVWSTTVVMRLLS